MHLQNGGSVDVHAHLPTKWSAHRCVDRDGLLGGLRCCIHPYLHDSLQVSSSCVGARPYDSNGELPSYPETGICIRVSEYGAGSCSRDHTDAVSLEATDEHRKEGLCVRHIQPRFGVSITTRSAYDTYTETRHSVVGVSAWRIVTTVESTKTLDWSYMLLTIGLQSHLELWLGILAANLPMMSTIFTRLVSPRFKSWVSSMKSSRVPRTATEGGNSSRHTIGSHIMAVRVRKDFSQLSESDASIISSNKDVLCAEPGVQTEVRAQWRPRDRAGDSRV